MREGHISDEVYDRIGFPNDVNHQGQIVNRYSDCDSRKRACLLNHEHANKERKGQVLKLRRHQYENEKKRYNASLKLISKNSDCERRIGKITKQICDATLENFDKCLAEELSAFILVRVLTTNDASVKQIYLKSQNIRKLPNRMKLLDAHSGKDCLLLRAFSLRAVKVLMAEPTQPTLDLNVSYDIWSGPLVHTVQLGPKQNCQKTPGDFLGSEQWRKFTISILDQNGLYDLSILERDIASNDLAVAQKLYDLLSQRLPLHIAEKVDDNRQRHVVWDFVRLNLAPIVGTLVLLCHVKDERDLKFCHGDRPCLLRNPEMCNNFLVGAGLKTKVGCYLYWDKERKVFIRSGKATRDFEHRHKEHKAGSLLKNSRDLQSKFYASYPSAAVIDKVDEPLGVF